ncbi:MAG: glycine cleavage system protein GcvH [Eubacteriales bacterium]|nr:glycine cleavage system protein GcvH [Eubacteriales bacterium]MDD4324367.1 glycine cleavage system protein GcvH [Eubacteriales bacterium]MDD4540776.1 glycine cleavage system protein GcvH [Eubacteriales bacterium]
MTTVKEDLRYAKTHEWVKVEGNVAWIGITDFAQDQLGDLVYAEAEPVGEEVEIDDLIGSVESVKMASDLFSPISGKIVESNESIEDEPEQINEDAFGTWFVKIEMSDPSQLDDLMDAAAYEKFCEEESA